MFGSSSTMSTLAVISCPSLKLDRGAVHGRDRKFEGERSALPGGALHPEPAAEVIHDLAADRQPQPCARRPVGAGVAALTELLEDGVLVLVGHARSVVGDVNPYEPSSRARRRPAPDPTPAGRTSRRSTGG